MTDQTTVLGLDLSMTASGVAHGGGVLATINPRGTGDTRLCHIRNEVLAMLQHGVDLAVVEDLPTHARAAGITGMVHGVVRGTLITAGVAYALVPPATLKRYATGRGNATKPDMRMALYQRAGIDVRDDNQVDAWWLRHMGLDHLGVPLLALPRPQRDALARVRWPTIAEAEGSVGQ